MKVVIADDEVYVCSLLKHLIDWNGLGLSLAGEYHNGNDVISHFEKEPVDILICDIEMPGLSGNELIKHVATHYPQCKCMVISGFRVFEYARSAYITTDKTGKYVIASNHGSYFYTTRFKKTDDGDYLPQIMRDDGSLALFRVREDGGLEDACDLQILEGKGYDVFSQASAHPHAVEVTRDDYVIAPNKGADTIDIFVLDKEKDKLIPAYNIKDEPGSAPRHLAIHPIKPMFFVMNEFNNKIVSYRWDVASGEPEILAHTFTVPMQFVGKTYTSCDIKIHPSGNFVYGTNHTFKSIVAYKVDQVSGKLSLIGNFREEIGIYREISIDLTGKYLVAGDLKTDLIDVFEINQDTGVINKSKHSAPAIYPSCIHFAKTN